MAESSSLFISADDITGCLGDIGLPKNEIILHTRSDQNVPGLSDPADWHLLGNTESDDDDLEEDGSSPLSTTDGADEVDIASRRWLCSPHDMYV